MLAPQRTAARLRRAGRTDAGALLVRMVGVRNATMGLRTLQATGDEQRRAVQAGLASAPSTPPPCCSPPGAACSSKRAARAGLLVLGSIAGARLRRDAED